MSTIDCDSEKILDKGGPVIPRNSAGNVAGYSVVALFCLALGISAWSVWGSIKSLRWEALMQGIRLAESRPFNCGKGFYADSIRTMQAAVPERSSVFFWTRPEERGRGSVETRMTWYGYFLYPRSIRYLDDSRAAECDFLCCPAEQFAVMEADADMRELLGKFRIVTSNDAVVVMTKSR